MGNNISKAQGELKKKLEEKGYTYYQTLDQSIMDKQMGGAQIWQKTPKANPAGPNHIFVKEKLSMNSVEFNRNIRALQGRQGLTTVPGAEEHLGKMVDWTQMTDSSWCTNYYKTYTATEYFGNNLEFNLRMKRDLNQDMPDKVRKIFLNSRTTPRTSSTTS